MVEPRLIAVPSGGGQGGCAVVLERSVPMAGAVELVLYHPPSAVTVAPGQFFQLAVGGTHTLLRRPYSAAWSDPASGQIGFIFNVVGAGSAWLAGLREGDALDLLGPLGRGFDLEGERPAICVAGGLGIAVFPGVVQALIALGRSSSSQPRDSLVPTRRLPVTTAAPVIEVLSWTYWRISLPRLRGRIGVGASTFSPVARRQCSRH